MDLPFEVVDLPATDHVEAGETAPEFTRPLVNEEYWEDSSLSDAMGGDRAVLVFHPMDGAFPTTYIWQEIAERGWDEEIQLLGVSISTPYEHTTLLGEREAEMRLFSDPANHVAEEYGVEHDLDGMTGVAEPRPAVFVLEPDRTVTHAWVAEEWPEFPDYDAVEAAFADR
ncbi:MAG: redoxin domain-containing protein [Halobacteriaceae archaeon]